MINDGLRWLHARMRHTLSTDRERGATALEYAGIIAIAALIVGALVAAINPGNITTTVTEAISDILSPAAGGGE